MAAEMNAIHEKLLVNRFVRPPRSYVIVIILFDRLTPQDHS